MYFLGEKNTFTHRDNSSTLTLEKRDNFLTFMREGKYKYIESLSYGEVLALHFFFYVAQRMISSYFGLPILLVLAVIKLKEESFWGCHNLHLQRSCWLVKLKCLAFHLEDFLCNLV